MPMICAKHYRYCDEKGICMECKGRPEQVRDVRVFTNRMKKVS